MSYIRAVMPHIFGSGDWMDRYDYPPRIFDQHFGMPILDSDFLAPTLYRGYVLRPRTQINIDSSGKSEVVNDKDNFQVMLNVSQFKPEEMDVKTVDNHIVIHGKHEERNDEHGFVSREFTRRYMIPQGVNPQTISSSLSQDGILTIKAPKQQPELSSQERMVPITMEKAAVEN